MHKNECPCSSQGMITIWHKPGEEIFCIVVGDSYIYENGYCAIYCVYQISINPLDPLSTPPDKSFFTPLDGRVQHDLPHYSLHKTTINIVHGLIHIQVWDRDISVKYMINISV